MIVLVRSKGTRDADKNAHLTSDCSVFTHQKQVLEVRAGRKRTLVLLAANCCRAWYVRVCKHITDVHVELRCVVLRTENSSRSLYRVIKHRLIIMLLLQLCTCSVCQKRHTQLV